jgi:hypothetical protein
VGKVARMFADSKYHNFALYEWVESNARWELTIVRRPEGSEGWVKFCGSSEFRARQSRTDVSRSAIVH